ncbi:ATP-binding protein [Fibrobacter sp. UWEL]|uniref:ATP-binding protein n=1 Tax=Fibrobacter sp. UWEL TaxID=1896209 RepID=UPI00091BE99F|nr:ATP-binding protein [Fibrobacter sp. UWEL]SHK87657.1 Histidine kinase-, DNA gyrase B-, and HSP90-like ATPase [Fibrobacter sp. UWEL]
MPDHKELRMKFDPNTISHLGLQMYSTLPPVLAELISNAYDADAHNVILSFRDQDSENKEIAIRDDGHGMTFDEINECFLLIGRNRRGKDGSNQKTKSGSRYAIGKKGIGKLAFFGIAKTIEIETVSSGLLNKFVMEWDVLEKSQDVYCPRIVAQDQETSSNSYTQIRLTNLSRKSSFKPDDIATKLAKTFSFFSDDFKVTLKYNDEHEIVIDDKLRFENLCELKSWNFPFVDEGVKVNYFNSCKIKGRIIACKNTVPEQMRGVALFSRGKLVNNHSFFDVTATSFGYSYLTGWLDIDFIDEWNPDVISTNRQSLNWEDSRCVELKQYLESVVQCVYKQHKELLEKNKKDDIKEKTGISIDEWANSLPKHERQLAQKLVNAIVSNEGLDVEKAAELTSFVKDSFQYTSFKDLASEISEDAFSSDKMLELMKEWQLIEAREMYKLAQVRIETIQQFKKNVESDAKEVPVMHNFFKQFPWLLDPRIMSFKDEVWYSSLLKDKFPENESLEEDKRIDFLCQNFASNFFVIELKRPSKVLGKKELEQALGYKAFIQSNLGNENTRNVVCYLIGNRLSNDALVREMADSYRKSGSVIVRTYSELLSEAIRYHQEFIDKYRELESRK